MGLPYEIKPTTEVQVSPTTGVTISTSTNVETISQTTSTIEILKKVVKSNQISPKPVCQKKRDFGDLQIVQLNVVDPVTGDVRNVAAIVDESTGEVTILQNRPENAQVLIVESDGDVEVTCQ